MISVIIPAINEPLLEKTIETVWAQTKGDVEFIVIVDGGADVCRDLAQLPVRYIYHPETQGRRVSINQAAKIARGSHLFILDAHCSMSEGWDEQLLKVCQDNTIVVCAIQDMFPDTFELRPGLYTQCYLNTRYTEKWWGSAEQPIEEMMCFTGCAWLIPKDYYWQLNGYDESLGKYGWDGPEWALKVWLNEEYPGRVLLCSDVICGHVFGTNIGNKLYAPKTIGEQPWYDYAHKKWGQTVMALVDKFNPPDWRKEVEMPVQKVYHTTINKVDECEDRDDKGNIIRRYKIIYSPFVVAHDGTKTERQISDENVDLIVDVDHEEDVLLEEVA